jgi:two-component system, NarL family, invasion response regulator UvrY
VTKILVIDDHPIVLQGCRRLLEDAGFTTVLDAGDATAGYELFCRHLPDVVIVDLSLRENGLGGLSLIERINSRDPRARILALSMYRDPAIVAHALKAGASGYILKDTAPEDLLDGIRTIQEGNSYLSPGLALQVALASACSRQKSLGELTPRELETLTLLAAGKSYTSIAEELNVGYKTVVNTASHLKRKLDAHSLPALVRKAAQLLTEAQ